MAQILANKIPIDSNPRKAVGYGFPLNGNAVFTPTYTTREQTKANLINFLLTNTNERVFNPSYGANLRAQIYEVLSTDSSGDLEDIIIQAINERFPNVEVKEINFNPQPDTNTLFFTLTYEVALLSGVDEINIELT
jgi:phage baseplate assembly protein W|tara:strand:- start:2225 stop:2632 length:408 start_codon:yes stop_codon:yes gene_type:complete